MFGPSISYFSTFYEAFLTNIDIFLFADSTSIFEMFDAQFPILLASVTYCAWPPAPLGRAPPCSPCRLCFRPSAAPLLRQHTMWRLHF